MTDTEFEAMMAWEALFKSKLKVVQKAYCKEENLEMKLLRTKRNHISPENYNYKELQIIQKDDVLTIESCGYVLFSEINRARSKILDMKTDSSINESILFSRDNVNLKQTDDGWVLYAWMWKKVEIYIQNIDNLDVLLDKMHFHTITFLEDPDDITSSDESSNED